MPKDELERTLSARNVPRSLDATLTSMDSESVRTSSLDKKPSLFLSWILKNHSMLSIRSLNITPSSPETTSWSQIDHSIELHSDINPAYLEREGSPVRYIPEGK